MTPIIKFFLDMYITLNKSKKYILLLLLFKNSKLNIKICTNLKDSQNI